MNKKTRKKVSILLIFAVVAISSFTLLGCANNQPPAPQIRLEGTVLHWNEVEFRDYAVYFVLAARGEGNPGYILSFFSGLEGHWSGGAIPNLNNRVTQATSFDLSILSASNRERVRQVRIRTRIYRENDGSRVRVQSRWVTIDIPEGLL